MMPPPASVRLGFIFGARAQFPGAGIGDHDRARFFGRAGLGGVHQD